METLCRELNKFSVARGGNVAIIFGLALLPIIGAAAAAVDYSRANSARSAMQAAIDSTALMLAKEVQSISNRKLNERALSIFNSLYTRPEAYNIKIKPKYDDQTGQLTLTGSGTVKTTFAHALGIRQMAISTMTEVVVGGSKVEIALVLDNTGSMESSGKIEALINASKKFITEMKNASKKPGDVKVAVVPFDTHVNIGTAYKDVAWIDWSLMDDSSGAGYRRSTHRSGSNRRNQYGDARDDTRRDGGRSGGKTAWTGCVIDRTQPYDTNDTAPGGDSATWYPAEECDLAPLLPLTYDWDALTKALNKMKADGKTNLTVGLVWGWHALSAGMPLTEGEASKTKVTKYIVFLTDGENTQNRWTTDRTQIDARTKTVCDNIRAQDIKVYTIRVKDGNEALLKACATEPNMYYEVQNANQIADVFNAIAKDLTSLRIAR